MPQVEIDEQELMRLRRTGEVVASMYKSPSAKRKLLEALKDLGKDYTGSPAGFKDVQGHGTHTAATMVAAKNGKGLVGACPAAKVIPIKVLNDQGSGASIWIAAGTSNGLAFKNITAVSPAAVIFDAEIVESPEGA